MSPEALLNREYSLAGDVWSFGVVIFEMITKGTEPYENLTISEVVLQISQQALALTITEDTYNKHKQLVHLLNLCMKYNAKDRPTFKEILDILNQTKWKDFNEKSE